MASSRSVSGSWLNRTCALGSSRVCPSCSIWRVGTSGRLTTRSPTVAAQPSFEPRSRSHVAGTFVRPSCSASSAPTVLFVARSVLPGASARYCAAATRSAALPPAFDPDGPTQTAVGTEADRIRPMSCCRRASDTTAPGLSSWRMNAFTRACSASSRLRSMNDTRIGSR